MKRGRVALLPLLAGVLVPKCPMCIAAYLTALGLGASAAAFVGTLLVRVGPWAALVAALVLGVATVQWMRRRGLPPEPRDGAVTRWAQRLRKA